MNEIFLKIYDYWILVPLSIPIALTIYFAVKIFSIQHALKIKGPIIPHYKPPGNLSPVEMGTLIDEKLDIRDVVAEIISLVVKGYIKVKEIKASGIFQKHDYELELLKSNKKELKEHEKVILYNLFLFSKKIKISDMSYMFYKNLRLIRNHVYDSLKKKGYFSKFAIDKMMTLTGIGIGLMILPIVVFSELEKLEIGSNTITPVLFFTLLFTGMVVFYFGGKFPKKTIKGARLIQKIRGLEEYIITAQKERIKFQEKENIFSDKLLPYAIILNLADKWAFAFDDLYKKPPKWWVSTSSSQQPQSAYELISQLFTFSKEAQQNLESQPRSNRRSNL